MSSIRHITVEGSHREIGEAMGREFAPEIASAVRSYAERNPAIVAYLQSDAGRGLLREMREIQERHRPEYMLELTSMAAAAGVAEEDLLPLNMEGTLALHAGMWDEDSGCSTCTVLSDSAAAFGHNEDGAPSKEGGVFLLSARPTGKPAFTALVYAGLIPGNAFGFNEHGVCHSINNVCPRERVTGIGRGFLARGVLEAEDLESAIAGVTVPGRASGYNYTIASVRERRIVTVEVSPSSKAVRELSGSYFHSNHYLEIPDVSQRITPSSRQRLTTWESLSAAALPKATQDILRVLGNTDGGDYPIFRTHSPVDGAITLTTVLFDLDARTLKVLMREKDGDGRFRELYSFDLS
ncbi:MAG: C45 family autoproteolytic acyltransferase/hydrolase [Planctomycetota bacterium]|jgi:predicted choloylglycine hydrolase